MSQREPSGSHAGSSRAIVVLLAGTIRPTRIGAGAAPGGGCVGGARAGLGAGAHSGASGGAASSGSAMPAVFSTIAISVS